MLGVRHQEAQVCNLAFRYFSSAFWSHMEPLEATRKCVRIVRLSNETFSGQASKIWARTSFRQISLQLRPILHGRLRPCYLLSRLIANRLATWWPTTQKTHLSTTGTQWTQPRRTKTCVWQSIWKRIINELHFLLYSMTLWVPSLTWNTETRKLQAAREDKSRVDWRLWLKLLCIPDGIRSSVHDLSGFPTISSGRLNTMSPADARRT